MKVRLAWLCLPLVIGLAVAGCGSSNSSNISVAISPSAATVLLGTSVQFIPSVSGSNNAITWSVNGVANGNATVGTISSTGLYTAPITRPVPASAVAVPVIFAMANAAVPGSGSPGSVIELQSGFDFTNFAPGNTINIAGNSVAGWNGSFLIVAVAALQNGNVGVQIANPAGPPPNGLGGTATATPNITITAQVQSTSAIASAIITLDSGIRVSFAQPTCTVGTGETFDFTSFVTVSGNSNLTVTGTSNQKVTWSVSSGIGTIDPNSGVYTAPPPPTTGTATITATSQADPTESASATLTIVPAADPTLSSLSPPTGALGAALQQVYLTGANFICTTSVLVNGTPLPPGSFFAVSSSTLLVNVPGSVLAIPPTPPATTVPLTFTVEREGCMAPSCLSSPSQLILSPVRPAVVAATPDSIPPPGAAPFNVTLDGGYFGTGANPVVNAQLSGQTNGTLTFNSDNRQMVLAVPASDVTTGTGTGPGLYAINVTNNVNSSLMAAVNLAVQPASAPAQLGSPITVGVSPTSVAIDTASGIAVVTNHDSNNITLINLATQMAVSSLCTDGSSGPCTATGPVSVAVDNIRNLALVANNANAKLAVVDISAPTTPKLASPLMTFPSADPTTGIATPLAPQAVGVNPVTGRALVAFSSGAGGSNAGAIVDLTQSPPALLGVVNINTGPKTHIAVSSRLNWALATPGGAGSLSIVDLGRQTVNSISSITCNSTTATVTVNATVGLQVGQPVLISGVSSSNNGIFSVKSASNNTFTYSQSPCTPSGSVGTASYAQPVATIATDSNLRGVSINDESQKALLANPTNTVPLFVFNLLDQTSASLNTALFPTFSTSNNVATAMSPLTNVGVVINSGGQGYVIDPITPAVLSTFTAGTSPVDVAIDPATNIAVVVNSGGSPGSVSLFSLGSLRSAPQIIQSSFSPAGPSQNSAGVTINSSLGSAAVPQKQTVTLIGNFPGTPVPRLDGNCSSSAFIGSPTISNGGRMLTATISGTFLANNGPRLYALDVVDSCTTPTVFSNAARLQVIQAVSLVTGTGTGPGNCASPSPQGVAIDAAANVNGVIVPVAVVTEPGCNDVAMINLATGTGFGTSPELAVGTTPQGVAVYPQAGLAVVANAGINNVPNVSIVDIVNDGVPQTVATTTPLPSGVAIDLGTGNAVVTASGASVVDVFPVSASTAPTPSTIGVQSGPTGVAVDPLRHFAVVANSSSGTASLLNLTSNSATFTTNFISFPQGVAFDPITNKFFITSEASNQVIVFDPNTGSTSATLPIRVGIGPSSIAYNFESATLVTANNLSGTMTVVDFIDQTVRGVFSLPSSTQFAVDIHPQTNLAVVADPVDNQLLLVPLPH